LLVWYYVSMSQSEPRLHLALVLPHSAILNKKAEPIPETKIRSTETQWLIREMLSIARGEQGDTSKRTMVGLAAPQVGVGKRIIIVDITSTGMGEEPDLRVFINPEIIDRSIQTEEGREGCYSTGNVCGVVERASSVTVKAYDQFENKVEQTFDGFTARIFQHEMDHLDGIRFPERIMNDDKLHWVEPDQFGDYRKRWSNWDVLCTRQTWEKIKS
jgi:peptide deformylase